MWHTQEVLLSVSWQHCPIRSTFLHTCSSWQHTDYKELCSLQQLWSHTLDYGLIDKAVEEISLEKAGASPRVRQSYTQFQSTNSSSPSLSDIA